MHTPQDRNGRRSFLRGGMQSLIKGSDTGVSSEVGFHRKGKRVARSSKEE